MHFLSSFVLTSASFVSFVDKYFYRLHFTLGFLHLNHAHHSCPFVDKKTLDRISNTFAVETRLQCVSYPHSCPIRVPFVSFVDNPFFPLLEFISHALPILILAPFVKFVDKNPSPLELHSQHFFITYLYSEIL